MVNNGGNGFLLITKFYKSANSAALLAPKNHNPEEDADVHLKGTDVNNHE